VGKIKLEREKLERGNDENLDWFERLNLNLNLFPRGIQR